MEVTLLWRGSERRACHSEKELEVARKEGFHAYVPADNVYPRWMYRGEESVIVASAEDETAKVEAGFGRDATYNPGVGPELTIVAAVEDHGPVILDARLANQAAQIADLTARIAEIEGLLRKPAEKEDKGKKQKQEG